jgi:hypothetical protein
MGNQGRKVRIGVEAFRLGSLGGQVADIDAPAAPPGQRLPDSRDGADRQQAGEKRPRPEHDLVSAGYRVQRLLGRRRVRRVEPDTSDRSRGVHHLDLAHKLGGPVDSVNLGAELDIDGRRRQNGRCHPEQAPDLGCRCHKVAHRLAEAHQDEVPERMPG